MDYSLYEDATGGQGLKRARQAYSPGGVLTTTVKPEQSMLPEARARLRRLVEQQAALEGQEPDTAALQAYAKQQGQAGESAMLNALAAQFAGESFAPVQTQFLKRAAAAREPMKIGGGMLTPDGQFVRDPFATREREMARLDRLIGAERDDLTAAERAEQQRLDREAARQEAARRDQRDFDNRVDQQNWMRQFQTESRADRRALASRDARLPFGAVQDISKQAGTAESMVNIASTFKPEYASRVPGVPGVGTAENYLGRAGIGNKDRANWWQNYNEQANIIRNQLFGSALTLTEKAAFEAAMISPDMDANVIQTRLNQQAAAAKRAYDKLVATAGASGYNVSGLPNVSGNVTGTPPGGGSAQPKKRIRFDAQGNEIP